MCDRLLWHMWFVVRLTVTYWNAIANVWTDNSRKLRSVLPSWSSTLPFLLGSSCSLDWVTVGLLRVVDAHFSLGS